MKNTLLAVALVALVALAAPAAAAAHATLLRTRPLDGAVVTRAPRVVLVEFDDTVRVGSGTAAVSNTTGRSVLAGPAHARGHALSIPLVPRLQNGDYSVRWSVVSQDGHRERGVLAFAVGAGSPAPHAVVTASTPLGWVEVILKTLYYLGVLVAAGAVAFGFLTRRIVGDALRRPLAHLLFFALLLAFIGASGLVHSAPSGTRFALILKLALTVSLVGGAAAALAPMYPALLLVASGCGIALLAAPTLSGHALDRDQPRWLSVPADLAHSGSAAVWLGGLAALLFVLPRATRSAAVRSAAVRRFSATALVTVGVLGATGLLRALTELRAISQVWSTSYGQALIAKSLLFAPLLGLGWLNRAVLLDTFARLQRSVRLEMVLIAVVVVVVALLTSFRPGVAASRAASAAGPLQAALPPALPPAGAVVDARELGSVAVAVARTQHGAWVTLVGPDGTGLSGRDVRIDGRGVLACGAGCYRGSAEPGPLVVSVGGATLRFDLPAHAPAAAALLDAVTRRYRSSRSIVFQETLASSPTNREVTRWEVVAPHTLAFTIDNGGQGIVIGARRWDRSSAGANWLKSGQTPLQVTQPYWRRPTNVHRLGGSTLTFLDRAIPAWFRVTLDARGRPAVMRMTAAAHVMVDRYVSYDVPVVVSPPPSR